MNMLTVYHLDDTICFQEKLLRQFQHQIIDCYDIEGKNLYCDNQALQEIHTRYKNSERQPIALIGSGNYHYITYLHLLEIETSFTLILFDHHTDLMDNPYMLTCGSWVAKSLRELPHLKKVIIVGPNPDDIYQLPQDLHARTTIIPDYLNTPQLLHCIYEELATENIYISIDKDVLDETYSKTNWDHGHMKLPILLKTLSSLFHLGLQIHGIDICGEWLGSPENSFTPTNQTFIKRNEKANMALLDCAAKAPFIDTSKQLTH